MKVLLSTIGTRGDVQPLLALALELRARGHESRLCAAPNFKAWVESYGFEFTPIGPDLKQWTRTSTPMAVTPPSPEVLRQLAVQTVCGQFQVIGEAAQGCDLIVATGVLQIAARSIAEARGMSYVFAVYAPVSFISPDHPPTKMLGPPHSMSLSADENLALWAADELGWNSRFGETLNSERATLGLPPVDHVYRHLFGKNPWLAADSTLAPTPSTSGLQITRTGAWVLEDQNPLPDALEQFLAVGEPPVYFGFGSMRAAEETGRTLIEAARAVGRRAILSQGWGNLRLIDDCSDCISIDDVNHQQLFPRVAAIVHHGGAGTTTAAASAGTAQVIVPHTYDQPYWAHRVQQLGVGSATGPRAQMTVETLASALRETLRPDVMARAKQIANQIDLSGASVAAERLIDEFA